MKELKMILRILFKLTALGFCSAALAACGGGGTSDGGGGPIVSPPPTTFQNATPTQTVTVLRTDGTTMQVNISTEYFSTLSVASAQTYSGMLSDGAVAGLETQTSKVPNSGTFQYTGGSSAVINDGSHFYELSGTSSATLTLANSSSDLDVTLSGFSGQRTDAGTGAVTTVPNSDIAITWQNATLTGSRLGGGEVNVSNTAATLSGNASVNVAGSLFGPSGEELGGLISVNDPGNLEVSAGFIARK